MKILEERKLLVLADSYIFELRDESSSMDISIALSKQSMSDMFVVTKDAIGVLTARNMTVPVIVRFCDSYPDKVDVQGWDQIVECCIEIASGKVVIMGNEYFPKAPRLEVGQGLYGAQICWGNLDALSPDGLSGDDKYEVSLWNADEIIEPRFIKRRRAVGL